MSKKKTDWQIARGLADWVMALGLKEDVYFIDNVRVEYTNHSEEQKDEERMRVYISNGYVNLSYSGKYGLKKLAIHENMLALDLAINDELSKSDLITYLENLDIRKENLFWRNKLRFLVKDRKKRAQDERLRHIARKKKELKELMQEVKND